MARTVVMADLERRHLDVLDEGRCDQLVVKAAQREGFSRAQVRRWFEAGRVRLERNGHERRIKKGERAVAGDVIRWSQPARLIAAEPDAPLQVLLETEHWVVVDKPPGQACAPLGGDETGALAQALLGRYPEMFGVGYGPREPGLIHRLDNDTSGLVWAARTEVAFALARRALKQGDVDKRYLLVCEGELDDEGSVALPVRTEGPTVRIDPGGRAATTHYRVLRRVGPRQLVEASASPAVRHQVRIHMAHLGAPLVGDVRYGGNPDFHRHALHASRIAWAGTQAVQGFEVAGELPDDMAQLLS